MATSYGTQNTFLTPDVIAREALLILEDNIVAPQMMSTSATADFTGAKVGDTIRIRRPAFFGVDEYSGSADIKIQDAVENSVNLKIEKQFDVSFEVSSAELAFAVDEFNERLLKPAMSALAQKIDQYALSKIANLGGLYGVPTTYAAPKTLVDIAAIVEKMNHQMIPMTNRKFLVSPAMQSALYEIDAFVRADIRGGGFTSPVQEAQLGRFMGLDTVMSQNLPKHSVLGTAASTGGLDVVYATAAAYKEGTTTINITGGPAAPSVDTIVVGDTLAIDYIDGVTREHVVTNSNAFSSAVITGIQIFPALYGVGGAVAVDQSTPDVVASGATVRNVTSTLTADRTQTAATPVPSYTMGAAFHPSAFQLVFVPQPNPMGPGTSSSTVNYNGMSLRVLQSYDHIKKRDLISVDCLVGAAAVDGRLGVRVASVNG
jgi:hypothetical protein